MQHYTVNFARKYLHGLIKLANGNKFKYSYNTSLLFVHSVVTSLHSKGEGLKRARKIQGRLVGIPQFNHLARNFFYGRFRFDILGSKSF